MNETKTTQPTPDQLLTLLDLQIQAQRSKRQHGAQTRTAFRVGAVALIIVVVGIALLVLQFMLSDLPRPGRDAGVAERAAARAQQAEAQRVSVSTVRPSAAQP